MPSLIESSQLDSYEFYQEQFGLSDNDACWLASLLVDVKTYLEGDEIAIQGDHGSNVHLLNRGWAYSAIEHEDGSRTVLDIHIPGDFIISPGILTSPRSSTLFALTDCALTELDINEITSHTSQSPAASQLFLHILGQHHEATAHRVAQMTRMPAITRLATFYLSLLSRLQAINPEVEDRFFNPATQSVIADLLGMTSVHASRTHSRLRDLGALTIDKRVVSILDKAKLKELSLLMGDF